MATILRGQAGAEDLNFGLGSFPRMEGFSSRGIRKQISAEDFPVEDILGQYNATETEAALAELWEAAWGIVTSAADALYAGGYISDKTDWINDIMEEAANTAGQVNDETEEGVDPTDTRPVITPPAATVLYIRHPSSVRPSTLAMLWVEGIGGQAPYSWDFVANKSGGSLAVQTDTGECLYTAGTVEATDTIKVIDANGVEATAQIAVSATAPVIAIFGPGEITIGGNTARLRATGGATPHTWSFHEHITNSTLSFTQTTAVAQSTATFTSGTSTGRDTVKVLETGGQIALHPIDVIAASLTDTEPVIHGATSAYIDGDELLLQVVGGETPMTWAIVGDGTLVDAADANDPEIVEMGELWDSMYGSGGATRLKVYRPPSAATTDTITVTDADGDEDTHLIAVIGEPVSSRPTIYGAEVTLENQVILLRVYGGTPPYTWEMLVNNSGASLAEYDNDEDGNNHYTSGRSGGTEAVPVQDIVRVTDANGYTDDHTISVYDAADAPDPFPDPDPFPPWWNEDFGYLQVNIAPAGAITAGARWRVNGGTWNASGVSVEGFDVGEDLNVEFKEVTDWTTPSSQGVQIVSGANVASGTYDQTPDAVSYFSVGIAQASYYIGKRMKATIIPRDSGGDPVSLGNTSVKVSVDAGKIDVKTETTGFVRSAAASSKALTISGASDDIYFVWWPDGSVPASITITVELSADSGTNGNDSVNVDAAANVDISLFSGADYISETKYENLVVRVKDGNGDRCEYFQGDIRLTPDIGNISLDGLVYTTYITLSIGPTHDDRPDIYLLNPAGGTVTITARIDEDTAKTDTQAIDELEITFGFGSLWTPTTDRGLMKDETEFEIVITAYRGEGVATDYDLACTLTADLGGSVAGVAIGNGDWTDGKVSLTPTVDWDGSQPVITLTLTDNVAAAKTGSRAFSTEDSVADHSEVAALQRSMRHGEAGLSNVSAAEAYANAVGLYNAAPGYDTDNDYLYFYPYLSVLTNTVGRHENHAYDSTSSPNYMAIVGYGIALYHVPLTNFDDSHHLFAEITFDTPAWQNSTWAKTDLIIGVVPRNYDVSGYSSAGKWLYVTSAFALHVVAAATIGDGIVVLVDLGVKKSDIQPGIPIQVQLRPNISSAMGGYVNNADKYSNILISKIEIIGY